MDRFRSKLTSESQQSTVTGHEAAPVLGVPKYSQHKTSACVTQAKGFGSGALGLTHSWSLGTEWQHAVMLSRALPQQWDARSQTGLRCSAR